MEYPPFNSKALSDGKSYDLTNSTDRLKYFHAKLGSKIEDLKSYLETGTFVSYMLAKKLAGKGTYAKMIQDVLGADRVAHISVGDVVRKYHLLFQDASPEDSIYKYFNSNYRGLLSVTEAVAALLGRSQDRISVPTDFLLAMLKKEITDIGRKALFIDGLPRNLNQISSSLYFRDLINYREDPDFFIIIEAPLELLNARMTNRRVCPLCSTSRNLLFTPTSIIRYDNASSNYYMVCDNKDCSGYKESALVIKEGDNEGIKSIQERLNDDQHLMEVAATLQGIPKILVRSSYPENVAKAYLEDYEIQTGLKYELKEEAVSIVKTPWVYTDDSGIPSVTTYAATYVVNILTQIHGLLFGKR